MKIECYHCGLPADKEYQANIGDQVRDFCCYGCQAVAQNIFDGGLNQFYVYRDKKNIQAEKNTKKFEAFDLEDIQSSFIQATDNNTYRIQLSLSGITCTACAWLIEHYISQLEGLVHVHVNVSSHLCQVEWDKNALPLSQLLHAFSDIGYQAHPANESTVTQQRVKTSRKALQRLGVAGLGMMQVGMVAIALHAGALQQMDEQWQHYLRWISLCFAIPIILYSAYPFFNNAYHALKLKHLTMDVPVALALSLAFGASCIATISNTGEVYFDSVAMFTFFLLLGRYLEMRARFNGANETWRLSKLLPLSAERILNDGSSELVPIQSIANHDRLWIHAGEIVPCDGTLESPANQFDESQLTGESMPQNKIFGDQIFAGSLNGDQSAIIRVSATANKTKIAAIQELTERAQQQKPHVQKLIDKMAGKFVGSVIAVATITGCFWWWYEPHNAFWIVLSILVVTCPCALSLATPAALTTATSHLRQLGLLITAPHVLEGLSSINHVIFDKTGTLTHGELSIEKVIVLDTKTQAHVLSIISSLEQHFNHPIAKAFSKTPKEHTAIQVENVAGAGVKGCVDGENYRFGTRHFALQNTPIDYPSVGLWQLLADEKQAVAWVLLSDAPRKNVPLIIKTLIDRHIRVSLVSGDRIENVKAFANELPFSHVLGGVSPQGKLEYLRASRNKGDKILMVGDGLNDLPVLSSADISVAMSESAQLTKTKADAVLLNGNLKTILDTLHYTHAVKRTIWQNISWAIGYNIIALPAAALGWVPPYLAAIGMSLSSLVVVINSLQLSRKK